MRARDLGLLTSGVLGLAASLAACGASDDSGSSPFGAGAPAIAGASPAAGTGNAAGTSAAGASAAGSPGAGGASGGAPSAGAPGSAGAGGTLAQGGSGGTLGAAGASGSVGMAGTGGSAPTIPAVKFVVYIADYSGSWSSWATKIDFSKVTHLNLAFFEATKTNGWKSVDDQSDTSINDIVTKAHASGVKVLASLGGGNTDTTVSDQYKNPANDDALVANLDAFLTKYHLDGADIDIEKESKAEVGDNYGTFVSKVVAKLRPQGKLVTAAVAQYLQPAMNDSTLHLFDFVNIMIYSQKTSDYTSQLNFYVGKGMKKEQLTLGIISESGDRTSPATAKTLTTLSKSWGGAMLWEVAGDATGADSVYKAIQGAM